MPMYTPGVYRASELPKLSDSDRIWKISMNKLTQEVQPFINPRELDSLSLWGREFFLDRLENYSNG